MLVGTLLSYALFGVTTTQVYIYSTRFHGDPRWIKAMVGGVWLCELGHAICIAHSLYVLCITNYGHPESLAHIPNSLLISTFLGGLISSGVETFFGYRIYVLSKSLWIPMLCWAMALFQFAARTVGIFGFGIREPLAEFVAKFNWLFDAVWVVGSANDLLIAATLVFLLYRQRSNAHKSTAAMVDKLITWTIETGVVTSMAGIIMLGFFVSTQTSFVWLAWYLVIARLFSNSLMASLNSRASLRANNNQVMLSDITPVSATLRRPTGDMSGSVEMNKVTITTYDE